jgi:hypothetical protein
MRTHAHTIRTARPVPGFFFFFVSLVVSNLQYHGRDRPRSTLVGKFSQRQWSRLERTLPPPYLIWSDQRVGRNEIDRGSVAAFETGGRYKRAVYSRPSRTLFRPDSCAQTALFRIPERFSDVPCYKSYNGVPRSFPPASGQVASPNKAWFARRSPRGSEESVQVVRIQTRAVLEPTPLWPAQSTWYAAHA